MTIKTVTVSGVTTVNFDPENKNPYFFASEKYAWIRNWSDTVIFASLNENCTAYADGTTTIAPSEVGMIVLDAENALYISGTGSVEVKTTTEPVCPFKGATRGGEKLLRYLGVTTTILTDGATTNPIIINGSSVTAKEADWAIYSSYDFIFNGTIWQMVNNPDDYYTKTETDALLAVKANTADVVLKSDIEIKTAPTTAEINAAITDIWGA